MHKMLGKVIIRNTQLYRSKFQAKQLGDLNIPLAAAGSMTGADLNRAIDAINNLPTVNCH